MNPLQPPNDILLYTAHEFAQLFRENNEVTFASDRPIRITNIDPILGHKFSLSGGSEKQDDAMTKMFNEILLLSGKTIKKIVAEGFTGQVGIGDFREDTFLQIESSAPLVITAEKTQLHTTVQKLFTKMSFDKVETLTLSPGQSIAFHNVPKAILHSFEGDDEPAISIFKHLSGQAPKGYLLELHAEGFVWGCSIDDKALVLESQMGLNIKLKHDLTR